MSEERIIRVSFSTAPCQCVRVHSPKPLEVEKHHIYPQSEQKKKHGWVIDQTTVALCDTGHKSVHVALTRKLRGEDYKLRNRYLEAIAQEGYRKIKEG